MKVKVELNQQQYDMVKKVVDERRFGSDIAEVLRMVMVKFAEEEHL